MSSSKKRKQKSLLSRFLHSHIILTIIAYAVRCIVGILLKTLRVSFEGSEHIVTQAKTNHPTIFAIWHNSLLLVPLIRRVCSTKKYHAVVSKSQDGDLLAAFIKTYPEADVIRVAHNTRHQAALQIVDTLKQGNAILITPDGPRGPRYVVKEGTLFCAQKSQADILGLSWKASWVIELPTWDRFRIPLPFSKVKFIISPSIHIIEGSDPIPEKEQLTKNLLKAHDQSM